MLLVYATSRTYYNTVFGSICVPGVTKGRRFVHMKPQVDFCNFVRCVFNVIKVSDPFFSEILEIWSEANHEEMIISDYHFRTWYNSLVTVENRPVSF